MHIDNVMDESCSNDKDHVQSITNGEKNVDVGCCSSTVDAEAKTCKSGNGTRASLDEDKRVECEDVCCHAPVEDVSSAQGCHETCCASNDRMGDNTDETGQPNCARTTKVNAFNGGLRPDASANSTCAIKGSEARLVGGCAEPCCIALSNPTNENTCKDACCSSIPTKTLTFVAGDCKKACCTSDILEIPADPSCAGGCCSGAKKGQSDNNGLNSGTYSREPAGRGTCDKPDDGCCNPLQTKGTPIKKANTKDSCCDDEKGGDDEYDDTSKLRGV